MTTTSQIRMELKFCELCGSLWLRRAKSSQVYCQHCQPQMLDVALPRKKPPVSVRSQGAAGGAVCA